jgi:hypothetical protein
MDDDMAVSVVVDGLYRDLSFTAVGTKKFQCRQAVIFSNKYESSLDFLIRGFGFWMCVILCGSLMVALTMFNLDLPPKLHFPVTCLRFVARTSSIMWHNPFAAIFIRKGVQGAQVTTCISCDSTINLS